MYRVLRTRSFERSYKKIVRSGTFGSVARHKLEVAIDLLTSEKRLPQHYADHALIGELAAYRECHIKGDILLVYQRIEKDLILVLVDIGSHSALFD